MWGWRRATGVAAMVVVLGLGTACSAEDDAQEGEDAPTQAVSEPSPEPSAPPGVEVAWEAGLNVHSDVVEVDGVVLVYASQAGLLHLVALDASTGEELWRQEASPGARTAAATLPVLVDGDVVYYRPVKEGSLKAKLVTADPATGEDDMVSDPLVFTSRPQVCEEKPKNFCVRGGEDEPGNGTYVIDAEGKAVEEYWGRLGYELADNGLRKTMNQNAEGEIEHELKMLDDEGWPVWEQTTDDLFGEGYDVPQNVPYWTYDESSGLNYGSVERVPDDLSTWDRHDFSKSATVAFDATDGGEVAWRDDGSRYLCDHALKVSTGEEGAAPLPVRCRAEGVADWSGKKTKLKGIDVTVEGFDPKNGKTTWELALGDSLALLPSGLADDWEPVQKVGAAEVLLDVDGDPTVLDLDTGQTRGYDGEVLWCTTARQSFEHRAVRSEFDGESDHTQTGVAVVEWSDVDGTSVSGGSGSAPIAVPDGVGVDADGLRVVGTSAGVVAYQQP